MKNAKRIFAIIFLIMYLLYAGNALMDGGNAVVAAVVQSFPAREGMAYYADLAGSGALLYQPDLLELHAGLQNSLGKTESGGLGVVKTSDGRYVTGSDLNWNPYYAELFALRLNTLNEELRAEGLDTSVTYISPQPQIINGYTTASENFPLPEQYQITEDMLYYMRAYNIDTLDTESVLAESGRPLSEYVYRTHSRWTAQAGLEMARALIEKINDQNGSELNLGDFEETVFEDVLVGDMGMAAGKGFTGSEDFTVLLPASDTSFTYDAKGFEDVTLTGSFEEVMLDYDNLDPPPGADYSAYAVFMNGGAYYQRVITNHDQPDAPKVLVIHDASALHFGSYLAMGMSETHMYWPTLDPAVDDFNVVEYIKENDIDYVYFISGCNYYSMSEVFQVLP